MKTLLLLLLACPLWTLAQTLPPPTVTRESLKPIENELVPTYYGGRYGQAVRSQYMYDGLDIKARNLAPYIAASADPIAIQEFNKYMNGRHAGGWLIAGGIISSVVGVVIMASNGPDKNGNFIIKQPYVCPSGYICGGSLGTVYGGQVAGYQDVVDHARKNAYSAGGFTLLTGLLLTSIGWVMQLPGQHVRRAVQHYNKSLKERTGVSWQLTPYGTVTQSGVGLVGRF